MMRLPGRKSYQFALVVFHDESEDAPVGHLQCLTPLAFAVLVSRSIQLALRENAFIGGTPRLQPPSATVARDCTRSGDTATTSTHSTVPSKIRRTELSS